MKILKFWAAAAAMLALTTASQATPMPLVDVGDGTVYDPNQHLIWLKDWNSNGSKDWATQKTWAEGLVFAGSSDWHLPSIDQYIDLSLDYVGALDTPSLFFFRDVQSGNYWSDTEQVPAISGLAWYFHTPNNQTNLASKGEELYAVAVRSGDVTVTVREPQTLVLVLLALGATTVARRRRPH